MTQYDSPGMNPYDTAEPKKKGWFGRNWWWFLPTVILLPLLCCCGGPIGFMWWGVSQVQNLPPYKDSIAEVQQNPDIIAELGSPIPAPSLFEMMEAGGDMDAQNVGGTIYFDAMIPMSGPNGSGTLWVEAESSDSVSWTYIVREFTFDHNNEKVDLMPGGSDTDTQDNAGDVDDSANEPADSE